MGANTGFMQCDRGRSDLPKNLLLTLAMRVTIRPVFHF